MIASRAERFLGLMDAFNCTSKAELLRRSLELLAQYRKMTDEGASLYFEKADGKKERTRIILL